MQTWNLICYESVDSTNSVLKSMDDAPHGTAVCSRVQTAGRGRLGRSFSSEEGGLYLSVLLKREEAPQELLHLTAMVAVAVRRAIFDACGVQVQLKWVNDLIANGKKLGGILTELAGQGRYIIGIGINCNTEAFPPELGDIAVSLHQLCERVDEKTLLQCILVRLQEMDTALCRQKKEWMQEYAQHCLTLGKQVRLIRGEGCLDAYAEGIDSDGALLVRYPDGSRASISSGEASVRGMFGYVE